MSSLASAYSTGPTGTRLFASRVKPANALSKLYTHQDPREPSNDRRRIGCFVKSGCLKQAPGAHICHGEIHLLSAVVNRIPFDGGGVLRPRVVDGAGQQRMGYPSTAKSRPYPDAPHRPNFEIIDMRNLAVAGEVCLATRCHCRPSHNFGALIGKYPDRPVLHQLRDLLSSCSPPKIHVLLRPDAIGQTPADVSTRSLGTNHCFDIAKRNCRTNLDSHVHIVPGIHTEGNWNPRRRLWLHCAGRNGRLCTTSDAEWQQRLSATNVCVCSGRTCYASIRRVLYKFMTRYSMLESGPYGHDTF